MGVRGYKSSAEKLHTKEKRQRPKKPKVIEAGDYDSTDLTPDEKSILSDIEWVFHQLGGRKMLLREIRQDPKIKKDFLKAMLAMEIKKVEQGLKGDQKGGNGTTGGKLFILKGLYDSDAKDENSQRKSFSNILEPNSQGDVAPHDDSIDLLEPDYQLEDME